jgi:NitT/TauT family transport system substrate-binding protein
MKNLRMQILYAAAAVAACAWAAAPAAQAEELKTINYMSSNERSCNGTPAFAMQSYGYLADQGYKLNMLSSDTTVPYVAFLKNGQADLAVLDAGQVLQAVAAGQPVKVVYEAYQYAPEGIVVTDDSPIQGLADLKGKTIGLASDRDQLTSIIALETVGLTIDDVKTVVVGDSGPVMAKALQDRTIDAFAGGATDRAGIEAAGVKIRNITPPEVSRNPAASLAVWGPTMEEKRPLIEAFLRSWAMGSLAGSVDTQAMFKVCKLMRPEQWEKPGNGPRIVNNSVYTLQARRTVKFGELQPENWKKVQAPYVKFGDIDHEIPVDQFLDSSFIDPANNFTTDDVKKGIDAFNKEHADLPTPN